MHFYFMIVNAFGAVLFMILMFSCACCNSCKEPILVEKEEGTQPPPDATTGVQAPKKIVTVTEGYEVLDICNKVQLNTIVIIMSWFALSLGFSFFPRPIGSNSKYFNINMFSKITVYILDLLRNVYMVPIDIALHDNRCFHVGDPRLLEGSRRRRGRVWWGSPIRQRWQYW